ncbi:MAG: GntR family transcriptional regulator [Firmicutes bacterium]|nr:GntR family transcriptional regulator [Bacillota bacterium]
MEMEREQQTLQAQIKRILRDEIAQGVWQSGARIPTESELMHRFSVSRITVSQALKDLVQEGLVVRRQGRGTFVSAQQAWVDLSGLLQRMPTATPDAAHANTRVAKEVPPADVALDLRLSPGEKTWRFVRAKLVGGSPLAWEQAYIPDALVREEPARCSWR